MREITELTYSEWIDREKDEQLLLYGCGDLGDIAKRVFEVSGSANTLL